MHDPIGYHHCCFVLLDRQEIDLMRVLSQPKGISMEVPARRNSRQQVNWRHAGILVTAKRHDFIELSLVEDFFTCIS